MEYTKGEWKANPVRDFDGKKLYAIHTYPEPNHIQRVADVWVEANANLIASAPDLYEACKDALDIFTQHDAAKGVISGISLKLNEAKRKAEGKDE